jgi:LCP family protein required for cell wall assembly
MRKAVKRTIFILFILVIGTAGYYGYSLFQFANKIHAGTDNPESNQQNKDDQEKKTLTWKGKDRVNILLLGGDVRLQNKNARPRSDSILLVSLDPVTKKANLYSILRDTYVNIPGHGQNRINTAITFGGPDLAMETVSDVLGIPVPYYVYTDFEGFKSLIDAIGGIDFEVEKDMKYTDAADGHRYDIDLKKGFQHLDGEKALQYVRFRHDALSDFTRTERQRNFLEAVAEKLKSSGSVVRLPQILDSVAPYIQTNLTAMDMLKLATLAYQCDLKGLVSEQLPPNDLLIGGHVGGASVLRVDEDALKQYVQSSFADKPDMSEQAAGEENKDVPKK